MTFIQPFASPEIDLEGMHCSAFICLMLLVPGFQPLSIQLVLYSSLRICLLATFFSLSLFFCVPQQRVVSVNQARALFFSGSLISADDVSKEVKGTT